MIPAHAQNPAPVSAGRIPAALRPRARATPPQTRPKANDPGTRYPSATPERVVGCVRRTFRTTPTSSLSYTSSPRFRRSKVGSPGRRCESGPFGVSYQSVGWAGSRGMSPAWDVAGPHGYA